MSPSNNAKRMMFIKLISQETNLNKDVFFYFSGVSRITGEALKSSEYQLDLGK